MCEYGICPVFHSPEARKTCEQSHNVFLVAKRNAALQRLWRGVRGVWQERNSIHYIVYVTQCNNIANLFISQQSVVVFSGIYVLCMLIVTALIFVCIQDKYDTSKLDTDG